MADVWEDLTEIVNLAEARDAGQLLNFGRDRCADLAGELIASSLAAIEVTGYIEGLEAAGMEAAAKAHAVMARAIYFEYDLDNGWSSNFFICRSYTPTDSGWASDWQDHVEGPSMPAFAAEYDARFATDAISRGRTVMLVARTLAALLEATTWWPNDLVLGAAYHDQDQVSTIR